MTHNDTVINVTVLIVCTMLSYVDVSGEFQGFSWCFAYLK